MPSPSAEQVAQMRTQRTASLRETCVITPAVVPGGTPTPVTTVCNVYVPKGGMAGGGEGSLSRRPRRSVTFPWGTVLKTGDRFTCLGRTLEVGDMVDPVTNSTAVHADCIQVSA